MVSSQDIIPSGSEDASALAHDATQLVDNGRWQLCDHGRGLERQFRFKTFKATWVSLFPFSLLLATADSRDEGFHERSGSRV